MVNDADLIIVARIAEHLVIPQKIATSARENEAVIKLITALKKVTRKRPLQNLNLIKLQIFFLYLDYSKRKRKLDDNTWLIDGRQVEFYSNYDDTNVKMPIDIEKFEQLLRATKYDQLKSNFLVDGFKNGFDLGYRGNEKVRIFSPNLKFTVGDEIELWNKVMAEVKLGRYAGPYQTVPFDNFIQSPIGLVPKDGGKKIRLIFHLSYPKNPADGVPRSVNANTPDQLKSVSYQDFDEAIQLCLLAGKGCYLGKSDLTAAFRQLGMAKKWWKFLVMKAKNPLDEKFYYFFDKCLPFGAGISCSHFQEFSNALAHIITYLTEHENINYLDDFLFIALLKLICNDQLRLFFDICNDIRLPISLDKTLWATTCLVFLGLRIDTVTQTVSIPEDKVSRAFILIKNMLNRRSKKTTLAELQKLTGFLNFLCKCIVPGRTFTRRLYAFTAGVLKPYHHIPITGEMKLDLMMWKKFLSSPNAYCRNFFDFGKEQFSADIDLYTDASANPELGCGGINEKEFFVLQWNAEFIRKHKPSINYLELYAVTYAVLVWLYKYANANVTLFCDNYSVVHMINSCISSCKNCMVLIRLITMHCLACNVRLSAKHVPGVQNNFSDHLSRLEYQKFRALSRKMGRTFNGSSI